ncbi:hypothetical protein [Deinococcus cellulosilyticus]|uniref:Uncharacterized protein n=1 Tax=Deinococcus cellulosilyticus (strain DSM 18568 / NBRC 106333 / KACC 11606 / 5516J-15) TaxID=1223518 RepID=A0A511NB59_DEIC1|nr:hypothetical protein [Deinococcus cellulosilyticus]GEM49796.1 hypothetical protein DC3_54310 [Deinococcus cellulosilyticus NBRC 106333 = KACC 11606]
MKPIMQLLSAGLISLVLAACGSISVDNGSINPGTTPTVKDPNITSVTVNGNQLLRRSTDIWISGDADVFVKVTSNVGLDSLTYSLDGQSGVIDNPKASNVFRVSNLTAGSKTLSITATNIKGSDTTVNLPVKVDLTPASVAVVTPADASNGTIPKVSGLVDLKVAVTDAESGIRSVKFFQRGTTDTEITEITRNNTEYSTQIDTTKMTDGVKYFEVRVLNNAGLSTSKVIGLNINNTGGPTEPTPPVVRLLLASGDKTGSITIPFLVTSEDPVKIARLLIDGQLYKTTVNPPSDQESTFVLDTNLISVGTHQVTVSAETIQGKSATSNTVTINVTSNLSLPLFKISAPQPGAKLGGRTPVEISVVKKGSNFNFLSGITVEIIGFGGQVIKTLTIDKAALRNNSDGIYITEAVDWPRLTGSDNYDVRAYASIQVDDGIPAQTDPTFTISDQLTTGVSISNLKPPAANILIPSRNDPSSAVPTAVLNRTGGIFLQVTDENKLDDVKFRVDVRLVSKAPAGGAKITKYLYNLPLETGTFYHAISTVILDGSEYVENGEYTLQTISEDDQGNGNVQEVAIKVDRKAPNLAVVNANTLVTLVNATYAKGKPDKHSATWRLCTNPGTVTRVEYYNGSAVPSPTTPCTPVKFSNPTMLVASVVDPVGSASEQQIFYDVTGDAPAFTVFFSRAGQFQVTIFAQDLITGQLQTFPGPSVGVAIFE